MGVIFALPAPSARAQTLTYSYNALGRLTDVSSSTGPTVAYTYDDAGNRTQADTVVPPAPRPGARRSTVQTAAPAKPAAVKAPGGASNPPAPAKR
jgi:YD repeat-containing protein